MKYLALLLMGGLASGQMAKPSDCGKSIICDYDCSAYIAQHEKECWLAEKKKQKPKTSPVTAIGKGEPTPLSEEPKQPIFNGPKIASGDEFLAKWVETHCVAYNWGETVTVKGGSMKIACTAQERPKTP